MTTLPGDATDSAGQPDPAQQSDTVLMRAFAVQPLGDNRFRAAGERGEGHRDTMYGGILMGQAVQAAAATIDGEYDPHHLHAEFLKAGRAGTPLVFDVELTKDGRALSSRRVIGRQDGRIVIDLQLSFQRRTEAGPEYHEPAVTPFPAAAVGRGELTPQRNLFGLDAIDLTAHAPEGDGTQYVGWFRVPERLPDASSWPASVLALATDMSVPSTPIAAIGEVAAGPDSEQPGGLATTTINHTMWFHRPGRVDDWFLIEGGPLSTAYARGVALGRVYDTAARHIVSFVQEIYVM
jgi:acyl-CoA thioesterase II